MKDRIITITCSEYCENLNETIEEQIKITYECYDDLNPSNMDAIIRSYIYKMRDKLNDVQENEISI